MWKIAVRVVMFWGRGELSHPGIQCVDGGLVVWIVREGVWWFSVLGMLRFRHEVSL